MKKKITWLQDYSNKRQDSVWYGGDIVKIDTYRYTFVISAIGDISIDLKGEHYRDKSNSGYIGEVLKENGITTDRQLKKLIDSEELTFWDNNWFEYDIWDKKKKDYIDNGIDNVLDDSFDENDDFEWVDDVIHGWVKWNRED